MVTFMNFIKKYFHILITIAYGIFYLLAFGRLEQKVTHGYHLIHTALDDRIPFCEYFIIPYMLWFAYVAAGIIYFAFFEKNIREYYQLAFNLGIGMTIFLFISWVYPNGQDLRPIVFERTNFFTKLVQQLYLIDTPTNIFPSIHVYNSAAVCIAVFKNQKLAKNRAVRIGTLVLTVSIILSTMFLKQHSVLDVGFALILNYFFYILLYQPHRLRQQKNAIQPE